MKKFAGLMLVLTALWTVGCSTSPQATPSPSPAVAAGYNIVLVSFDAMRAQETSLGGYKRDTTPNLKKFAQGAVVFDNAIAVSSWTVPSTMSIFTGLWPSVHGVVNKLMVGPDGKIGDSKLRDDIQTLPQVLAKNGYTIAGFTGDAGVSGRFGYGRDMDTYLDDVKFGGMDHSIPAALQWIEKPKNLKFFVFLHGYDVHGQFDPPDGYKRTFVEGYKGTLKGNKDEQAVFREEALENKYKIKNATDPQLPPERFSRADGQFYQDLYDEKIHDSDARFGKFLEQMDKLGLTDKTIFVLLADHGEEFLEHGNIDHGPTLYMEMVHVPLIIKIPGMPPRVIKERVNAFDALPTVFDAVGVKPPKIDAVSLLPLMQGKPQLLPPVFSETDYRLYSHKRAAFEGKYHLIHSLDTNRFELYDVEADPGEQHPLDLKNTPPSLYSALEQWTKSLPQHYDYKNGEKETIKIF